MLLRYKHTAHAGLEIAEDMLSNAVGLLRGGRTLACGPDIQHRRSPQCVQPILSVSVFDVHFRGELEHALEHRPGLVAIVDNFCVSMNRVYTTPPDCQFVAFDFAQFWQLIVDIRGVESDHPSSSVELLGRDFMAREKSGSQEGCDVMDGEIWPKGEQGQGRRVHQDVFCGRSVYHSSGLLIIECNLISAELNFIQILTVIKEA